MEKNYIVPPSRLIEREFREHEQHYKAKGFWLTGPSGAGKSTIAHAVEKALFSAGIRNVTVLDGDRIRSGLCSDLGFSADARHENIRRIAHVTKLFLEQGVICLCSFISPYKSDRANAAGIIGMDDFYEIHVSCPQSVCEERDVKGFYDLARKGVIKNYTGVTSPYEDPERPALVIHTDQMTVDESVGMLRDFILKNIAPEKA
jgi:adenylylsulfate kinase